MENRTENGRQLGTEPVVAADVIARLSGCSGKDVTKVLLAIHALSLTSGYSAEAIVNTDCIPLAPADSLRFAATADYVDGMIHKMQKKHMRDSLSILQELNVHRRFGKGKKPSPPTLREVSCALG